MQRHTGDRGAALILLIGITAALAVLTAALVMLLANQQGATAGERTTKTSLYFTEAALDSAINAIKGTTATGTNFPTGTAIDTSQVNTQYVAAYPSPNPTPEYRVYDNATTVDASTPAYDANGDHRVWVQALVKYRGRTSRLRAMLDSSTSTSILPQAALYADTDITAGGTSDIFAVKPDPEPNPDGSYTFYTAGVPPYWTSIMAGGDLTGNSSMNLCPPNQSPAKQTVGINVNGTVSLPGVANNSPNPRNVGLLSDYFDQGRQYNLTTLSQTAISLYTAGTTFIAGAPSYNSLASLQAAMTRTGTSPNYTYTASGDLKYSGDLSLTTSGTTYKFNSLYVTGSLTITGNVTVNSTELYVGTNFTISGSTQNITDRFGAIYVAGTASWRVGSGGRLSVQTTTVADPTMAQPMYAQILLVDGDTNGAYVSGTGAYDIVLGETWVDGNAGTGNVAVNFSAPSSGTNSTVMCPVLATTEKTVSNGKVDFGTLADPMVYYMQCDNDGLYSNTCQWGSSGTFTGLFVIMEAVLQITGGNDGVHPNFVGSVMAGTPVATDITLSGNSSVCYNQAAIDNLPPSLQTILRTSTTTTVPGTWQQLSAQ
jgi:hypothetical protein